MYAVKGAPVQHLVAVRYDGVSSLLQSNCW